MVELEKKLGGSKQIVASMMKQLDPMEVPQREELFNDIMEQCQKIERNIERVDMVTSFVQDSIFLSYKDLLPQKNSFFG